MQNNLALLVDMVWRLGEVLQNHGHQDYPSSADGCIMISRLCGLTGYWQDGQLVRLRAADMDVKLETLVRFDRILPRPANDICHNNHLIKHCAPLTINFIEGNASVLTVWHDRLEKLDRSFRESGVIAA